MDLVTDDCCMVPRHIEQEMYKIEEGDDDVALLVDILKEQVLPELVQKLEASEAELEEAQAVATAANHKYEDVSRKLKVVQGDLDRVIERAEEFEAKSRLIETEGLV